jgi:endonuclease/exonuclease/phosphatase (EEP) superfamily protein YafD
MDPRITDVMDDAATSRPPSRFRRARRVAASTLAVLALVHPAACLGARLDWRLDMVTHFAVAAWVATLLAVAALAFERRRRLALVFTGLAICQAAGLVAFWMPNPSKPWPSSPTLRLLVANVYKKNHDYQAIADLIRRERPDVVGLVEVLPHLVAGLEATGVAREYPYRYVHPVGVQGLALWFREPPVAVEEPAIFAPRGNPVYRATVNLGGRPVRLWLVHPPNPIGVGRERANPDLEALGRAVGRERGTRIVAGDMNRTEGSPYFGDFLVASGLRDSRLGLGPQPSWPAWSPYRIPIDHAFISDDLAVVDRRLGPSIGSDHFPLILDVAFASPLGGGADSTSSANRAAHQSSSSGGPAGSAENLERSTARR